MQPTFVLLSETLLAHDFCVCLERPSRAPPPEGLSSAFDLVQDQHSLCVGSVGQSNDSNSPQLMRSNGSNSLYSIVRGVKSHMSLRENTGTKVCERHMHRPCGLGSSEGTLAVTSTCRQGARITELR